ncbi:MAG: hypothetical protein ACI8XU_002248 [Kiritimatiellia bacterium]|jgi:hypothetical protein
MVVARRKAKYRIDYLIAYNNPLQNMAEHSQNTANSIPLQPRRLQPPVPRKYPLVRTEHSQFNSRSRAGFSPPFLANTHG